MARQFRLAHFALGEHGPQWVAEGELDVEAALAVSVLVDIDDDVVLNLARVTFIDSSGLRGLLALRADLEAEGRELMLINPSARVLEILDLTGLRGRFDVVTARPLAAHD